MSTVTIIRRLFEAILPKIQFVICQKTNCLFWIWMVIPKSMKSSHYTLQIVLDKASSYRNVSHTVVSGICHAASYRRGNTYETDVFSNKTTLSKWLSDQHFSSRPVRLTLWRGHFNLWTFFQNKMCRVPSSFLLWGIKGHSDQVWSIIQLFMAETTIYRRQKLVNFRQHTFKQVLKAVLMIHSIAESSNIFHFIRALVLVNLCVWN